MSRPATSPGRVARVALKAFAQKAKQPGGWVKGRAGGIERLSRILGTGLLVLALWLYGAHASATFMNETIEDAAITYAYADNLGSGNGFRLTPGEAPVEGFSNFLLVLLLAPFAALDFPLESVSRGLNLVFVLAGLASLGALVIHRAHGAWRLLAATPALLAWLCPGFGYWSFAGLEGGILAGLQMSAAAAAAWPDVGDQRQNERHLTWGLTLGALCAALVWVRPEAAAYGLLIASSALLGRRRDWRPLCLVLVSVICLLLVRRIVFSDWVPNTYWAKIQLNDRSAAGSAYLQSFFAQRWWYFVAPLPLAALARRQQLAPAMALIGCVGFALYFAHHAGGDWMFEFRFIQPALAPYFALCAFGIVTLACGNRASAPGDITAASLGTYGGQLPLTLAAVFPLLLLAFVPPGGSARARNISASRNLSYERIRTVAPHYEALGRQLGLQRHLLHVDVDIGGTSYRSGLDIIDLAGLADRVLALGWTRKPAQIEDYLFSERRPDTIHLHGSWLARTPLPNLPAFAHLYRPLGPAQLRKMALGPLTVVRHDLVAPLSPPALRLEGEAAGLVLNGVSAIKTPNGHRVFVQVHTTSNAALPAIIATTPSGPSGRKHQGTWDAGLSLKPPGAGAWVTAHIDFDTPSPFGLEPFGVEVSPWPATQARCDQLDAWLRAPLERLAGSPAICRCRVDALVDTHRTGVAPVRGAAFVSRLCEGQLQPETRLRWLERAQTEAKRATDVSERYQAWRAAGDLTRPRTRNLADAVSQSRAQSGGSLSALAAHARATFSMAADNASFENALWATLAAGHPGEALIKARLLPTKHSEVICAAMRALGLKAQSAPDVHCPKNPAGVRVARATFELQPGFGNRGKSSEDMVFEGGDWRDWIHPGLRPNQPAFVGGDGEAAINTFGRGRSAGSARLGRVIWGPHEGPFSLLSFSGFATTRATVRVEFADEAGSWRELVSQQVPRNSSVLVPSVTAAPVAPGQRVRVIVEDAPGGALVLDSLALVHLPPIQKTGTSNAEQDRAAATGTGSQPL